MRFPSDAQSRQITGTQGLTMKSSRSFYSKFTGKTITAPGLLSLCPDGNHARIPNRYDLSY